MIETDTECLKRRKEKKFASSRPIIITFPSVRKIFHSHFLSQRWEPFFYCLSGRSGPGGVGHLFLIKVKVMRYDFEHISRYSTLLTTISQFGESEIVEIKFTCACSFEILSSVKLVYHTNISCRICCDCLEQRIILLEQHNQF